MIIAFGCEDNLSDNLRIIAYNSAAITGFPLQAMASQ
jgi:hypothetical protein